MTNDVLQTDRPISLHDSEPSFIIKMFLFVHKIMPLIPTKVAIIGKTVMRIARVKKIYPCLCFRIQNIGTGTGSSRVDEFRKLVFYISSFRDL